MTQRTAVLSGEFYTHRAIWNGSQFFLKEAREKEEGSYYNLIAAGLFGFLAFEAFLNYLGERIAPEVWAIERKHFGGRGMYPGPMGKLRFLAELCEMPLDTSAAPYTTVNELKERRHQLSHGKTEKMEAVIQFTDPTKIPRLEAKLYAFGDDRFVTGALEAVESIADQLFDVAKKKFGETKVGYGTQALRGMIEQQGGHIASA